MLGGHSFLEADRWHKAEVGAGKPRFGVRMPHVALLCRVPGDDGLTSGDLPDHLQHVVERHARAASNIVYTPRNAALCGQQIRLDRIGDEREIPRLLAVAVHSYRLAAQRRAQEFVETHVRPLTRSVDREIA